MSLKAVAPSPPNALFVLLADPSGLSRQTVTLVAELALGLRERGVVIEVHAVRRRHTRDQRVLDAFRRRGVNRLPALLADGRVYLGLHAIRDHYAALARPSSTPTKWRTAAPPRMGPSEGPESAEEAAAAELEAFFQQELRASPADLEEV